MCFIIILLILALSARAQASVVFTKVPATFVVGQPGLLEWEGVSGHSVGNLIYMGVMEFHLSAAIAYYHFIDARWRKSSNCTDCHRGCVRRILHLGPISGASCWG